MDYDIIVVGAGPAGLSAAVRAAWLGAPAAKYRASILVLEASDRPGGLSLWQPLVVTSPGVFFTKRELKASLTTCERLGVSIRHERVLGLEPAGGDGFEVRTAEGAYRCLSVVVATGCRVGHAGESRLFHRGRIAWFYGDDDLRAIADRMQADAGIRRLCLCGAEGVDAARRLIGSRDALDVSTWAEPPWRSASPPQVQRGRLHDLAVIRADGRLRLRFEREAGALETLAADLLLVDFTSYEATATTLGFLGGAAAPAPGAFLAPRRDMASGPPGLFSAGDANGAPFCVAKAMSEGTVAGFSAYAHVHERRTGRAPNLYPYYPYEVGGA